MLALLWPFLVYWLILFAACYAVVEFGQNYLYDSTTPNAGPKLALGTAILAAVLTYTRSSYESMFTSQIGMTVIQAIVWFAVFTLIFRFHPWHALAIGVVAMVILAGVATLAVDSLLSTNQQTRVFREPSKPVRAPAPASFTPTIPPPKAAEPAPDED